jgi:hypothetical protein
MKKLADIVQSWADDRDQEHVEREAHDPLYTASYVLWALGEITAAILREVAEDETQVHPGGSKKVRSGAKT